MPNIHPISEFRRKQGLSQAQLAKILGVQTNTVWRWENGTRIPRRSQVFTIIEKTGLTPAEILGFAARAS